MLPLEQQAEAWNKAVESAPKGKRPTGEQVQKVVDRYRAEAGKEKRMIKASEGWTTKELKKDTDLFNAFKSIASVYGADDTKAIRNGTVLMKRADVLFLARMPKENMLKIQELIFTTRWTPEKCVKFINSEPDDDSTVLDLKYLCLATKGKYWTHVFEGFTVTVKANRAAKG